jgi:hypothetical protein
MLNGDCGDKREECIATGGVMEYGVAGIAEALVCSGSVIRLVGWISWSYKGNDFKFDYTKILLEQLYLTRMSFRKC